MGPISILAWLGRNGSPVIACGVFAGIALPSLAALFKPLLVPAILLPFLIALIRMDWAHLVRYLRDPSETASAVLWLLLAAPILVHALSLPLGLPPPIHAGVVLMAAAPPLMASGSLALMLRLDVAQAVLVTIFATALTPFTLPLATLYLLGVDMEVATGHLMFRLGVLIGGCFVVAWCLRRLLPRRFVEHHVESFDGIAVLGLLAFALAIMDGVAGMLVADPAYVLGCAAAVYALNVGLQALGAGIFAWRGRQRALTMGLCSGNTNLGLIAAALADQAPVELFVFVAVAQLPVYTLPVIQRRLYRRWLAEPGAVTRPAVYRMR